MGTTKRILAVGAHPDDMEILCGGMLGKYARRGHAVIMAHLTNGDKGHTELDSKQLATIRRAEAEAAARVIAAQAIGLDLPDAWLAFDTSTRLRVVDLVREARPDIVITLSPRDYSSDHMTTSRLVCDATFLATAPLVATNHSPIGKIPPVFFCDTMLGINSDATIYVDITETFAVKTDMLACHKSQMGWLNYQTQCDMMEQVACLARLRGMQCGVKYAEAFSEYEAWPRKTTERLLP